MIIILIQNLITIVLSHDDEKGKLPREIELKILKQRNGQATASIDYYFDPKFNHYQENRGKFKPSTVEENEEKKFKHKAL